MKVGPCSLLAKDTVVGSFSPWWKAMGEPTRRFFWGVVHVGNESVTVSHDDDFADLGITVDDQGRFFHCTAPRRRS